MIELCDYHSFGSLDKKWTSKYDYDTQGNLVNCIKFRNGIPQYILERTYTYYK